MFQLAAPAIGPHLHATSKQSRISSSWNHLQEQSHLLEYHRGGQACLGRGAVPGRGQGRAPSGRKRAIPKTAEWAKGWAWRHPHCGQSRGQVPEPFWSEASPECWAVAAPSAWDQVSEADPRKHPMASALRSVSLLLSVPFPHPSTPPPVECRDTTRYCENAKQLKLCQLSQFKSRCCGTCGEA